MPMNYLNLQNFLSIISGSPCDQQLMTGVGTASLPRFYYDSFEDRCESFNYTGIGGNENNFVSLSECQMKCPG